MPVLNAGTECEIAVVDLDIEMEGFLRIFATPEECAGFAGAVGVGGMGGEDGFVRHLHETSKFERTGILKSGGGAYIVRQEISKAFVSILPSRYSRSKSWQCGENMIGKAKIVIFCLQACMVIAQRELSSSITALATGSASPLARRS